MAKAAITRKTSLSAKGVLGIEDAQLVIENPDTGELIDIRDLLRDFVDHPVSLSVNYDEDYE